MRNSGLGRVSTAQFMNDKEQARRSAVANLKLMTDNIGVFDRFPSARGSRLSGQGYKTLVLKFSKISLTELTDNQCSYIASIYDKFMGALLGGGH